MGKKVGPRLWMEKRLAQGYLWKKVGLRLFVESCQGPKVLYGKKGADERIEMFVMALTQRRVLRRDGLTAIRSGVARVCMG